MEILNHNSSTQNSKLDVVLDIVKNDSEDASCSPCKNVEIPNENDFEEIVEQQEENAQQDALNLKCLIEYMKTANAQWSEGKSDVKLYAKNYYEWIKLFQHFGS